MKLGAQLYTLRTYTQTEKDFAFSMKEVAEIGYTEVQISAVGPIGAEKIRQICDENGLKIALTHTDPNRIINDTAAVIAEHNIMGCDYIGIGSMPDKYRTETWFSHFVQDYKEAAKQIAASGKLLMYHNHGFEFEKINGVRMIETLMEEFTPEEMGITLDTYWVQAAGGDPVKWIEKLWDRIPCIHLKDMEVHRGEPVMAPVLEGNMNFADILRVLEEKGATKHLLVEQDDCLESPFVCLEKSYRNLNKLGYV
jgi:Xylose isomerase-like TIM barrel.